MDSSDIAEMMKVPAWIRTTLAAPASATSHPPSSESPLEEGIATGSLRIRPPLAVRPTVSRRSRLQVRDNRSR